MKERPILFSAPMVRAILDGRKTQTRRIVKPQPLWPNFRAVNIWKDAQDGQAILEDDICVGHVPKVVFKPGDYLWVREAFGYAPGSLPEERAVSYKVDYKVNGWQPMRPDWTELTVWRPSIHMPRWASRITLEIVSVRVERLRDITEEDAKAEGITDTFPNRQCNSDRPFREGFFFLWESINGNKYPWSSNPWVWCIEFRRVKQ